MKIPVKYYTEITDITGINDIELKDGSYFTNEGGKLYLVEVI